MHTRSVKLAVLGLYALAMVLVAFGHQPPPSLATSSPEFELSNYLLPDGTAPEICRVGDGAEDHDPSHGLGGLCDACRLVAAPGLPIQDSPALARAAGPLAEIAPIPTQTRVLRLESRGWWSRAPPVAVV